MGCSTASEGGGPKPWSCSGLSTCGVQQHCPGAWRRLVSRCTAAVSQHCMPAVAVLCREAALCGVATLPQRQVHPALAPMLAAWGTARQSKGVCLEGIRVRLSSCIEHTRYVKLRSELAVRALDLSAHQCHVDYCMHASTAEDVVGPMYACIAMQLIPLPAVHTWQRAYMLSAWTRSALMRCMEVRQVHEVRQQQAWCVSFGAPRPRCGSGSVSILSAGGCESVGSGIMLSQVWVRPMLDLRHCGCSWLYVPCALDVAG